MHKMASVFMVAAVSCASALSQPLDSNSITVSASRNNSNVQPDQVVLAVFVDTPYSAGLSDVLSAVQSLGLTASNFSTVSANQSQLIITPVVPGQTTVTPLLEWDFNLTVPLSKLKDTLTSLTNLQKSIGQNNSGLTLSFRVQTTQVSPQLQQAQTCSIPDLLTDARAQAQKLADASGLNLGAVLAVSGATANGATAAALGLTSIAPVCTITVKFSASRY